MQAAADKGVGVSVCQVVHNIAISAGQSVCVDCWPT